MDTFAYIGH